MSSIGQPSKQKRRLILVLLAVIVPSAAILGLGVRLLSQESRLAASRRSETLEQSFRRFTTALDDLGREAAQRGDVDSAVVFVSDVKDGQLDRALSLNPQLASVSAGRFGVLLARAETDEFGGRNSTASYARALAATENKLQEGFVRLGFARALDNEGRHAEADSLRMLVAHAARSLVDEFGVPLALYALATEKDQSRRLSVLYEHVHRPVRVTPQAAYLYRAFRDSLRALSENQDFRHFDRFVEQAVASVRLKEDFSSLYPLLLPRGAEKPGWILYANDTWLLTLMVDSTGTSRLVALDAAQVSQRAGVAAELEANGFEIPTLTSASAPAKRYLGPRFAGIYSVITPKQETIADPLWLRRTFLVLTTLLVISLLTLGVFFIWRDARRETQTARLRSEFVSSVSHELKTPLTSIRMYAETLRLRDQDKRVREEYLDTIINETGRLTRLLNNVLDFARIEKGTQRYTMAPVALQGVVSAALGALSQAIQDGGLSVDLDLPDEDVVVRGDADALEQVLLNLISNAIKYSGDARQIEVGLSANGSTAALRIADHGIGISSENQSKLFQPYFRVNREGLPRVAGTGLGLSIVHHTVSEHHGQIEVESEPGIGTAFTVTLPCQ